MQSLFCMHLLIDDSTMLIQHTTCPKSRKCTKTNSFSTFCFFVVMFIARIIVEFGVELAVIFDPKIDKKSIENSCKIDSKKQCENEAELGAVFHRFWSHLGTQDGAKIVEKRDPKPHRFFIATGVRYGSERWTCSTPPSPPDRPKSDPLSPF